MLVLGVGRDFLVQEEIKVLLVRRDKQDCLEAQVLLDHRVQVVQLDTLVFKEKQVRMAGQTTLNEDFDIIRTCCWLIRVSLLITSGGTWFSGKWWGSLWQFYDK